jgi:hypothetical protein
MCMNSGAHTNNLIARLQYNRGRGITYVAYSMFQSQLTQMSPVIDNQNMELEFSYKLLRNSSYDHCIRRQVCGHFKTYDSSAVSYSSLLRCDAVSLREQIPTFKRTAMPSKHP